jgi:hypothetical protein
VERELGQPVLGMCLVALTPAVLDFLRQHRPGVARLLDERAVTRALFDMGDKRCRLVFPTLSCVECTEFDRQIDTDRGAVVFEVGDSPLQLPQELCHAQ